MKIILALTDINGKNIAFITDDLIIRELKSVINLIEKKLIKGVHVVSGKSGPYVRSDRNDSEVDNLDYFSISVFDFLSELKEGEKSKATKRYENLLEKKLRNRSEPNKIIYIDDKARATKSGVLNRLKPLAQTIKDAAIEYKIDPNTLGAILIDEYTRSGLDDLGDFLGRFGIRDTSVGLAQIKMTTARDIISKGYYKDAPMDISDSEIYKLLATDKTSVRFAAAVIRMHIDRWKPFIDLKDRPEILGTLYSLGEKNDPHSEPQANKRGKQIKSEFYPLISEILK